MTQTETLSVAPRTMTPEQQRAIDTRDVSIALSAGAGCGKTFVLTERFLSHLQPGDDGAPPDEALHQLIAITFTDRAAREMRDRIRAKCYDRLQTATPSQVDYFLRLLRSLDTARVSTIHAFCGALLRGHAVEAQLDPRFAVLEQAQADTLLAETIEDLLREKLADHDAAALDLTEQFGLERLQAMTATLLAAGCTIDFDSWLSRTPAEVVAIWDRFRRDTVVPSVLQNLSRSPASRQLLETICALGKTSGELAKRCAALDELLPNLPTSQAPARDLEAIILNARVQGAGSKKTWPDETLYEQFKNAAELIRDDAKHAATFLEFNAAAVEVDAQAGLQLLAFAQSAHERYDARKQELACLDFNDLLHRAQQLLTDPAHADLQKRLAKQVRLLLVDECQDTDPVQVELIKALCGSRHDDGKLFFVGDYKQSIYRFRGADPGVFRRLQQATPTAGQMPLTMNFRSQPAILDFVNALFCEVLSAAADAMLQYEPLRADRPQATPLPAVEFLWSVVKDQKKSEAGAKDAARRSEAEFIARRIRGMLDREEAIVAEKQTDEPWVTRAVKQKDIAILFRTLSDVQHYEEALRSYGIDYYLIGGHAFYAQQEIYDVVNLLRALASPADVVSLAGVLRSPMFALDDESLFWLAQHPQGLAAGLFVDRLTNELSEDQRHRVSFAAATLRHLRGCKDRLPITALLNEAIALTGYDAALLAEFLGERKLANLRKLLDQARAFDQSDVLGLADFIVQLSHFVADQPREPLAATHPEGTNVVRLMTIHQAKGLEFPVVFVPDLDRPARGDDRSAVWSDALGPLVKVPTRGENRDRISGLDLHFAMSAAEDEAERVRLLYVATTRAADYLVLSSSLFAADIESPSSSWTKLLAERFDLQTGKFTASLPKEKEYHAPAVKVTTDPPPTDAAAKSLRDWQELEKSLVQAIELSRGSNISLDETDDDRRLAEPVLVDAAARRRYSVSRLSGFLQPAAAEAATTFQLDDEDGLVLPGRAADLGVLVHQVMARIDFRKPSEAAALVKHCVDGQSQQQEELAQSAAALIERFLQSPRAQDLAAAEPPVHRELEFLFAWPPQANANGINAMNQRAADRGLYLQGFIDCLYQDSAGRWHLLDYKTNQASAATAAAVAGQYEMQLGVYALAVEKILGQPPAEIAIHFLRPGIEHRFVWDDAMRQRTISSVNQAIAAAVTANKTQNPEP